MYLRFVALFILLSVGESQRVRNSCGVSGKSGGLVYGGRESSRGNHPWIVAIYRISDDQYLCGGTLVASNVVVTAAHCIQDKGQSKPRQPNDVVVKLGKHDLSKQYERSSINAFPSEFIIHPDWNYFTEKYDSDIAVIILEYPVQFTEMIFPVCLWNNEEAPNATTGFIVGWGKSETSTEHSKKPRALELNIHTNENCFFRNYRMALISTKNTFCAGKDSRSGPCHGDSGGGLFIKLNHRWYLRGITSVSMIVDGLCDISNDAVFTNVLKFSSWINGIISQKLQEPRKFLVKKRPKKEIFCMISTYESSGFDRNLCTILLYAPAALDYENLIPISEVRELAEGDREGSYKSYTSVKKTYPHLLVLFSIGGWHDCGTDKYSKLAADPQKRKRFARNIAEFLKKYGFDGLNFYWDYPVHRGTIAADRENYVELLREINEVFDAENLYLTATVRTSAWMVHSAYDLENMSKYVDFMLMITFDHAGNWLKNIAFHAPLAGDDKYNVEYAVKDFLEHGVPLEKMVLGLGFYGQLFVTNTTGNVGDESFHEKEAQALKKSSGLTLFSQICKFKKEASWVEYYDAKAAQAVGKYKDSEGFTHVITFDSPRSVANKVKYVMSNNLAGVWTFFVNWDDFQGDCAADSTTFDDFRDKPALNRTERNFPLLRTIKDTMELMKYLWKC